MTFSSIEDPVLVDDWHVAAASDDVPAATPIAARVLGVDLVLWRNDAGVMAWHDLCAHRGTRLSLGSVTDGLLTCPYHGWTYDATGRAVRIPAHPEAPPPDRARATTYRAIERYGWVWVSLGDPQHEPGAFTEWDDPSYRTILCGPYEYRAAAPRAVENFLDVAHFPFVHEGILGDPAHAEIDDYTVTTGPDGITADDITVWQPDPDGTGVSKPVTYTYRVHRPLTAYFTKRADDAFAIYLAVTPVDLDRSLGWMCIAMNYGHDLPEEELRAHQDRIALQDVPIVESQRPELLPLDLQAELHLKSDKTSIAYRRWLKELGVTFGTA